MRNAVLHEALKRYCVEALTLLLRKPASIHLCSKESRRSADAGVVLRKVGSDDAREAPAARVSRSLRSPLRQRQWRHPLEPPLITAARRFGRQPQWTRPSVARASSF